MLFLKVMRSDQSEISSDETCRNTALKKSKVFEDWLEPFEENEYSIFF